MGFNKLHIKNAAENELRGLSRTSFSGEKFTNREISVIASAITAAIQAYDEQLSENKEIKK